MYNDVLLTVRANKIYVGNSTVFADVAVTFDGPVTEIQIIAFLYAIKQIQ